MATNFFERGLWIQIVLMGAKKMLYKRISVEGEEEEIRIPRNRLVDIDREIPVPFFDFPYVNDQDELNGRAIYLDDKYDWILGKSEKGALVCVPLKKERK